MKGTMTHAKTSFSTEIFAGAIISVVQYLAPLRYMVVANIHGRCRHDAVRLEAACLTQPSLSPPAIALLQCRDY
jgi:hypothetical protein